MIEKNVWFMSSAGRAMDVDAASDEPSHIHIARPSRLLSTPWSEAERGRRDNSGSSVEPTGEVRDVVTAEVTVQAA
jgi:hypothetical protein